ncbi:unnamed protein product [Symbiodinium necroappetens]|uniref:Uncharacterized protein n=1 Tax=Symbiodinium necroappetens TaxID=1628268 RepID=A0A813CFR9_9DINO|nr:unnamed protein product [Symbiodinium necroappetens]
MSETSKLNGSLTKSFGTLGPARVVVACEVLYWGGWDIFEDDTRDQCMREGVDEIDVIWLWLHFSPVEDVQRARAEPLAETLAAALAAPLAAAVLAAVIRHPPREMQALEMLKEKGVQSFQQMPASGPPKVGELGIRFANPDLQDSAVTCYKVPAEGNFTEVTAASILRLAGEASRYLLVLAMQRGGFGADLRVAPNASLGSWRWFRYRHGRVPVWSLNLNGELASPNNGRWSQAPSRRALPISGLGLLHIKPAMVGILRYGVTTPQWLLSVSTEKDVYVLDALTGSVLHKVEGLRTDVWAMRWR